MKSREAQGIKVNYQDLAEREQINIDRFTELYRSRRSATLAAQGELYTQKFTFNGTRVVFAENGERTILKLG